MEVEVHDGAIRGNPQNRICKETALNLILDHNRSAEIRSGAGGQKNKVLLARRRTRLLPRWRQRPRSRLAKRRGSDKVQPNRDQEDRAKSQAHR
jgi:hypothetical protein